MMRRVLFFALLAIGSAVSMGNSVADQLTSIDPLFEKHVTRLNEFSDRRQLNSFFPNMQTVANGLNISYVNSATGDLTFALRDLVVVGRIPLQLGRLYSSDLLEEGGDFGQGWFLTYSEHFRETSAGAYEFIDHTASKYSLSLQDSELVYLSQPDRNVAYIVHSGGTITIFYKNRWTKEYSRLDESTYRLTQILDNNGNAVNLQYSFGLLNTVVGPNGRTLSIKRGQDGRIMSVVDDQGRRVKYRYDGQGLLQDFSSLSGQSSIYSYNGQNQLRQVADANGNRSMRVHYDRLGRVSDIEVHAKFSGFSYSGTETILRDETDHLIRIRHSSAGVPIEIENQQGLKSSVTLDESGNVVALAQDDTIQARLAYDNSNRLLEIVRSMPGWDEQFIYTYRPDGLLSNVATSEAVVMELGYDVYGNAISLTQPNSSVRYEYSLLGDIVKEEFDDRTIEYRYNSDGQIAEVAEAGAISLLYYNDFGRLRRVVFPDGDWHEFSYDRAGFRIRTSRSDGSGERYDYDPAGNLRVVKARDANGNAGALMLELTPNNQVEAVTSFGSGEAEIEYDDRHNPSKIRLGEETAKYEYDNTNRLVSIAIDDDEPIVYEYALGEPDVRITLDNRTRPIVLRHAGGNAERIEDVFYARINESLLGVVDISRNVHSFSLLSTFGLVDRNEIFVSSKERRRLRNLRTDHDDKIHFDKASNSFFLPPEFFTINCTPCLPGTTTAIIGPATVDLGEEGTYGNNYTGLCFPVTAHIWRLNGSHVGDTYNTAAKDIGFSAPGNNTVSVESFCPCAGIGLSSVKSKTVCVRPPFLPPVNAVPPAVTYPTLVGNNYGLTTLNYTAPIQCRSICEGKYRLEGDIIPSMTIKVSTGLPAMAACSASTRTSTNRNHTRTHELVHANALISVINNYKAQIGQDYTSQSSCMNARIDFLADLQAAYNTEVTRQGNHLDHAGERRHFNYCPGSGPTKEGVCGLVANYTCANPPGNFYPGP